MSEALTLDGYNVYYREQWNQNPGVPVDVYGEAGPGYLACRKNMRATLAGREDHRTPVTTSLPGAGASTVARAVESASGMGGDLFTVTEFSDFFQNLEFDWSYARRRGLGETYTRDNVGWQMKGHAKRVEQLFSAYVYGDGGGALARLHPDEPIAIGDTSLRFYLPLTVNQFHPRRTDPVSGLKSSGDTIEFAADKGGPLGAGVKGWQTVITGARNIAGRIAIEPGVPADPLNPGQPLLQPGDYVFIAGTYNQVIKGMAAWNPATEAELVPTFFGVNRADAPERLGGLRVKIPAGQDPSTKWALICRLALENNTRFKAVFTTTAEYEQISNAVSNKVLNGVRYTPKGYSPDMGPGVPRVRRLGRNKGVQLYIDMPTMMVENPSTGDMIPVKADPYLYNVDGGPADQSIYRGYDPRRFYMETVKDRSYWWVNYDGNGPIYQLPRSEILSGVYNVYGQHICEDPSSMLFASPDVETAIP